jgi:hypothetical protein
MGLLIMDAMLPLPGRPLPIIWPLETGGPPIGPMGLPPGTLVMIGPPIMGPSMPPGPLLRQGLGLGPPMGPAEEQGTGPLLGPQGTEPGGWFPLGQHPCMFMEPGPIGLLPICGHIP